MNKAVQILYHGNIRTLDPRQPFVTALAIQDGKISLAGSDQEVLSAYGDQAQVRDLGGKTVWPGLTDAHIHLDLYSMGLNKVDCETNTREECFNRIAEKARHVKPGEWILGQNFNQNLWPEGFGNAAMLDNIAPKNPVYLTGKSYHVGWANSLALQAAHIQEDSPNPERGIFQRDNHGKLTGIVLEGAMDVIAGAIPEPTGPEMAEIFSNAQTILHKMGITGAHDFDARILFTALQILENQDRLRLRIIKGIPQPAFTGAVTMGLRTGFGSEYIKIGSLKLFADGALGPQTAAMLEPYENTADEFGLLMLNQEKILEIGKQAVSHGISLAIHAIGDKAVHIVLNAYADLREYERQQGLPVLRHRIEHVQLLHPEDTHRLAQLGIIASMQPLHATSDMLIADLHWGKRAALSYAWRSVLSHQTTLAFGSDAPVEVPNPFWGMHAAVTRQRADGSPGPDGWYPEQRLTLIEALQAYTTGPAYAAGQERRLGQLTPGFVADLILLPEDPFTLPPEKLVEACPDATMVAGDWVWER